MKRKVRVCVWRNLENFSLGIFLYTILATKYTIYDEQAQRSMPAHSMYKVLSVIITSKRGKYVKRRSTYSQSFSMMQPSSFGYNVLIYLLWLSRHRTHCLLMNANALIGVVSLIHNDAAAAITRPKMIVQTNSDVMFHPEKPCAHSDSAAANILI